MGRYIDYADIANFYPAIAKRSADEVGSSFIVSVENWVDGQLATHFTVPFSSNNETVRTLCIDETYYRLNDGRLKGIDKIHERVKKDIADLKAGNMFMILVNSDGTREQMKSSGDGTWSTTQGEHSPFGMVDYSLMRVDSDTLIDEYDERGVSY